MDELIAFLNARLDEDERIALAFPEARRAWTTAGGYPETGPTLVAAASDGYLIVEDDTDWAAEIVTHIARHDPARVLADVAAKRSVIVAHVETERALKAALSEYEALIATTPKTDRDRSDLVVYRERSWRLRGKLEGLEAALRGTSLPYADHPDYREEWRSA